MADRQILAQKLISLMNGNRVYFQPPESIQLTYPCLIYQFETFDKRNANDRRYSKFKKYSLVYISKDSDDPMVDKIDELPYCEHKNRYVSDNLYHDSFILYF